MMINLMIFFKTLVEKYKRIVKELKRASKNAVNICGYFFEELILV
jgi:hypothetical protein